MCGGLTSATRAVLLVTVRFWRRLAAGCTDEARPHFQRFHVRRCFIMETAAVGAARAPTDLDAGMLAGPGVGMVEAVATDAGRERKRVLCLVGAGAPESKTAPGVYDKYAAVSSSDMPRNRRWALEQRVRNRAQCK